MYVCMRITRIASYAPMYNTQGGYAQLAMCSRTENRRENKYKYYDEKSLPEIVHRMPIVYTNVNVCVFPKYASCVSVCAGVYNILLCMLHAATAAADI